MPVARSQRPLRDVSAPQIAIAQDLVGRRRHRHGRRGRAGRAKILLVSATRPAVWRATGATVHDADDDTARAAKTYRYDAIGNIVNKSDLGAANYVYGTGNAAGAGDAGPHAVVSAGGNSYAYDDNGNMVSGAGRTLAWTGFNKPASVVDATTTTSFAHGPDRARTVQTRTQGATTTTIVYVASQFEQVSETGEATKSVHYIFAGSQRIAIRTTDDAPSPVDSLRYLHRDHLGSVDTITDAAGRAVERLSYDAFGKRRVAAGENAWTDPALAIAAVNTPRGFTGHEHLDDFQLVHMNGRVYDPSLGRFMSADPFVQFPESTQGLNRYSYVDNNPLSFTDPSGYFGYDYDWDWGYDWYSYPPFHYDPFGGGYGGSFYDPFGGGYGGSFYDPFGGPTDWTTGDATAGSAAGWAFPDFSRPGGFSSTVAHGWVGGSPEAASPGSEMNRLGPWAIYDPTMPVEARIASTAAVAGTATNFGGGKSANGALSGSYWRLYSAAWHRARQSALDRAALKALNKYNPLSVAEDREYAGLIYATTDGTFATLGLPGGSCHGGPCGSNPWAALAYVPKDAVILADYHTHGRYNPAQPSISYEYFSDSDVYGINIDASKYPSYIGGYLGTPSGKAFFYQAGSLNIIPYTVENIKRAQRYVGPIAK